MPAAPSYVSIEPTMQYLLYHLYHLLCLLEKHTLRYCVSCTVVIIIHQDLKDNLIYIFIQSIVLD